MRCSKDAAELKQAASFQELTCRQDLARLEAYLHDVSVQNIGRKSAVLAKNAEAFKLTSYTHDCADRSDRKLFRP